MKQVLTLALFAAASLAGTQAKADLIGSPQTGGALAVGSLNAPGVTYVYLAAAYNAPNCSQIAGTYGYPYYFFGPAWVYVNGMPTNTYVVNACFGITGNPTPNPNPTPGPVPPAALDYNVFVKAGVTATDCANAIEFQFGTQNLNCYQDTDHLHCTSKLGNVKDQLEQVACVAGVDPLNQ